MIRLTTKGVGVFNVVRDYSPNELAAIQSIMYEHITTDNFQNITALPQETLGKLTKKGLIKENK